jgi:hypothetical protein
VVPSYKAGELGSWGQMQVLDVGVARKPFSGSVVLLDSSVPLQRKRICWTMGVFFLRLLGLVQGRLKTAADLGG